MGVKDTFRWLNSTHIGISPHLVPPRVICVWDMVYFPSRIAPQSPIRLQYQSEPTIQWH